MNTYYVHINDDYNDDYNDDDDGDHHHHAHNVEEKEGHFSLMYFLPLATLTCFLLFAFMPSEMMNKCFMINAPWIFNAMWYFAQGLLSARSDQDTALVKLVLPLGFVVCHDSMS